MSGDHGLEQVQNLLEFFRDELTTAFDELGVETSSETEAYLVHLLESYSRLNPTSSAEVGFEKPAAILLEEAMTSAGEQRIEIYRRLGDASLYNCGFFAAHITRRSVSPDYYQRLGQTAYRSLGDMMSFKQPGGIFHAIFDELARKFDHVVEAFRVLSGNPSDGDGKYDRWLAAGMYPLAFERD